MQKREWLDFSTNILNILLKIGDDFAEGLIELIVELPVEDFLVIAVLGSEYRFEEILVDFIRFVGSGHNWIRLEVTRNWSRDLKLSKWLFYVVIHTISVLIGKPAGVWSPSLSHSSRTVEFAIF